MSALRWLLWCTVLGALLLLLLPGTGCHPPPDELRQGTDALHDGRRDQAAALFDSAIKNGARKPDVYRDVALGCLTCGANDMAADYARRGLTECRHATNAERGELQEVVGEAELQAGRPAQAIEPFRAALALTPGDASTKNNLGFALAEANASGADLQEALRLTLEAVKAAAQDPEHYDDKAVGRFLDSLGWVYFRLARFDEALSTLRQATDLCPDESSISYHVALASEAKGLLPEAYVQLQRAANAKPGDEAVQRKLAEVKAELAARRVPPSLAPAVPATPEARRVAPLPEAPRRGAGE